MRRYYNGNPEKPEEGTWNDRWIVEEVFKGRKNGYFIEAGACNGIGGSSTYVLEKEFGWRGILVEPVDEYFSQLQNNRPNSICFHKCLSGSSGQVEFLQFQKTAGCSTIKAQKKPRHDKRMENEEYEILTKDAVTFLQVLEEARAPRIIDYLGLDVNGAEYDILEKFPFDRYKFKAISVESRSCNHLLKAHGYVWVSNPFTDALYENYFIHKSCIAVRYLV